MDSKLFNIHDFVSMTNAFISILFVLMILVQNSSRKSKYWLVGFLLLNSLICTFSVAFYSGAVRSLLVPDFAFLYLILTGVNYLIGPMLYLYICSQTSVDFALTRKRLLHLLPLIAYAISASVFLLRENSVIDGFMAWRDTFWLPMTYYLSMLLYGMASCKKIYQCSKNAQGSSKIVLLKDCTLTAGFTVLWSIGVLAHMSYHLTASYKLADAIGLAGVYLLMILVVSLIILEWLAVSENVGVEKTTGDSLTAQHQSASTGQIGMLEKLMKEERPFLEHNITLERLAIKLSVRPRTLSAIINQVYGQSFFQFINRYRIEEAKRLLRDPIASENHISKIYMSVGFNSKSTFNAQFREIEGITPSRYRDLYRNPRKYGSDPVVGSSRSASPPSA